jgi:dTDP-4-amino-4,6-dideoxygalactose transaminase
MHLQPVFDGCEYVGGCIGENIFKHSLCLPSGSALTPHQQERVCHALKNALVS